MARVNPPLENDQTAYNPNHRVTGLFTAHDGVTRTLRDLAALGVSRDAVDVFAGVDGERALDPSGDAGGLVGRWFRTIERWVSDTSAFQELAAATLAAGGFVVAVQVENPDGRERVVMDVLTYNGATDVKYWTNLYVEQGHEDVPQSPAGPDWTL